MNLTKPNVVLLAVGLLAATPAPHPGHSSYAEASCNSKRRELQVSLGMLAIDFEATLSRRTGKRVNLDTTKGIKKIIETYLADRFVVMLPDGTKPRPRFEGREDKGKNVWIYFAVPLATKQNKKRPAAPAAKASLLTGIRLRNRVLMEHNREQRNIVELREGQWRRFLTFTEKTQEQGLRPKQEAIDSQHKKPADKTDGGQTDQANKSPKTTERTGTDPTRNPAEKARPPHAAKH